MRVDEALKPVLLNGSQKERLSSSKLTFTCSEWIATYQDGSIQTEDAKVAKKGKERPQRSGTEGIAGSDTATYAGVQTA